MIVQVEDDDKMPVDKDGNRADLIMDPNSVFSRMNMGVNYEMYVNAASRETFKKLCAMLGIQRGQPIEQIEGICMSLPDTQVEQAMEFLVNYYAIVSPQMAQWFDEGMVNGQERQFLAELLVKSSELGVVGLYMPPDNPVDSQTMVQLIEQSPYKPLYDKVTYVGNSGERVTTVENVMIASAYIVLLEKIGDNWSAVSSSKLQHFGVPSQLTKQDKYSKPAHQQAVRGAGEAEMRILISYVGELFVAEKMDRNNNPHTHRVIVDGILKADYPTNIQNLVDRRIYPFGGVKPIQLVSHIAECGGFKFVYYPYVPQWGTHAVSLVTPGMSVN